MGHVSMPLGRIRLKLQPKVRRLAPLEPDQFLAWAYRNRPGTVAAGTSALTLADVHFEVNRGLSEELIPLAELRREYVQIAARVRRNQRLGLDPWEGI